MREFDGLRAWLSVNLAPFVFLSAYLFTVVLGNFVYLLPEARPYLAGAGFTSRIFTFATLFTPGYWLLLLAPFFVTPLVVWVVRRTMQYRVDSFVKSIPDFSRMTYFVLLLVCYAIVFHAFWRADAFKLFMTGGDFTSSVEARFAIRERVGFYAMAVLMSLLHFLTIYAAVKWVRARGHWWGGIALLNAGLVSVFLVTLNMKWPIIIFYAGMVMAVFVYTDRRPFISAGLGMVALVLVYFIISAFVYRISPPSDVGQSPSELLKPHISLDGKSGSLARQQVLAPENGSSGAPLDTENTQSLGSRFLLTAEAVGERVPMMALHIVNRMAISYPYYYEIFTTRGQVCGGLLAQARVAQKCRPSYYVYREMFADQFSGRGTAPAAVHITSYALGGWPLAMIGLVCASVLLGLFASLPLQSTSLVGAMVITGGIVGYHLSQLPGEGPIIYDHGLIWVALMLCGYVLVLRVYDWIRNR